MGKRLVGKFIKNYKITAKQTFLVNINSIIHVYTAIYSLQFSIYPRRCRYVYYVEMNMPTMVNEVSVIAGELSLD